MKKEERLLFYGVLLVLAAALALLLYQWAVGANNPRIYRVTVLLDGAESDYWNNFRGGIDQAAREHNVDVRYLTHYEGDPILAQADALRREWEGEADGVVVIPTDGERLVSTLAEAPTRLAVAVMGPKPKKAGDLSYVSADYTQMGAKLAEAVAELGEPSCTLYLSPNVGAAARQMRSGLYTRLDQLNISYTAVATKTDQPLDLPKSGTLVAVEPGMTEALCRETKAKGRICGVGESGRLLHYLEDGTAAALVVQSDYDAGYLSMTRVAETLAGAKPQDAVLDSYTVTAENMFEEPYIQILFATP
ncbi:MAG: substrate-binding domain-containing protein [Pseudoflavonifractor sp.]